MLKYHITSVVDAIDLTIQVYETKNEDGKESTQVYVNEIVQELTQILGIDYGNTVKHSG